MAIKRFRPIQDTFIVKGTTGNTLNFGGDEILELGKYCHSDMEVSGSSRILLKFDLSEDIEEHLGEFRAILHLYLADAKNLPDTYEVLVCNLIEDWEEGHGKVSDLSSVFSGATWKYRKVDSSEWLMPGGDFDPNDVDGEFASEQVYEDNAIGPRNSLKYTIDGESADNGRFSTLIEKFQQKGAHKIFTAQSFNTLSSKDINIDITPIVQDWIRAKYNEGIVIGLEDESVADTLGTTISFFSRETHTIYSPYLEIAWDNTTYESTLHPVSSSSACVNIQNLQKSYSVEDKVQLRLGVRPQYPARVFSTSSLYRGDHILPENSYWGIKSEYTGEMVVPFSEYTKIGADNSGSYIDISMNLLEPERYYRLLIRIEDSISKITLDTKNIFKVTRNGRHC